MPIVFSTLPGRHHVYHDADGPTIDERTFADTVRGCHRPYGRCGVHRRDCLYPFMELVANGTTL